MTSIRLIFRNVRKNINDYTIYFMTLMISVSLFYAFNSVGSQPALSGLSSSKQYMSEMMGNMISYMSVIIAVALAFLVIYANQFLLKRRKKELGIYTLLGMGKGKMSMLFVGETLCIGFISMISGLAFGIALSQGLSIVALRLFAANLDQFQLVFSVAALLKTIACFVLIYVIVMTFNVLTISRVKLIDLLTASRKNDTLTIKSKFLQWGLFGASILAMIIAVYLFQKHGIVPSNKDNWFQIAAAILGIGMVMFFYAAASVFMTTIQGHKKIYLRGLNTFFVRQIGSKIRTDFLTLAVVAILLTVTICGLTAGISTAFAMNDAQKSALPYDLNVYADYAICGESDIIKDLAGWGLDMTAYAQKTEQISHYKADFTYGKIFAEQHVDTEKSLWSVDRKLPEHTVYVVSVSDFNRAMAFQGRALIEPGDDQFYMNCNYKGTFQYMEKFLQTNDTLTLGGHHLKSASDTLLQETYWQTSIGNNDRGTLIVPDEVVLDLVKEADILLVQYQDEVNYSELLGKLNPIGLSEEGKMAGYGYTDRTVLSDMFFSGNAIIVFLCSYISLIFLMICATLLSLKQLTETADNGYRYGLLQKLGTDRRLIKQTMFKQIAVFFLAPLGLAAIISIFLIVKIIEIVENFMNMHIASNSLFTMVVFLLIYGGYFLATYLACERMVQERHSVIDSENR